MTSHTNDSAMSFIIALGLSPATADTGGFTGVPRKGEELQYDLVALEGI